MNIQEKVVIETNDYIQPRQIVMVFLVTIGSLAMGLIPIIYGISTSDTGNVLPTEATLWDVIED